MNMKGMIITNGISQGAQSLTPALRSWYVRPPGGCFSLKFGGEATYIGIDF